ncbi:MAG TPA: DDE-type integrase/transposase/recombinase, partial [Candidatus Caenarcaniphilales bacterium]
CRTRIESRPFEHLQVGSGLQLPVAYSPQLDQRCRRHLRPSSNSWRADEVYVKVKDQGRWLYRAIDKQGDTLDFLLTAKRDALFSEAVLPQNSQCSQQHNTQGD